MVYFCMLLLAVLCQQHGKRAYFSQFKHLLAWEYSAHANELLKTMKNTASSANELVQTIRNTLILE